MVSGDRLAVWSLPRGQKADRLGTDQGPKSAVPTWSCRLLAVLETQLDRQLLPRSTPTTRTEMCRPRTAAESA